MVGNNRPVFFIKDPLKFGGLGLALAPTLTVHMGYPHRSGPLDPGGGRI
jgi:catalase